MRTITQLTARNAKASKRKLLVETQAIWSSGVPKLARMSFSATL